MAANKEDSLFRLEVLRTCPDFENEKLETGLSFGALGLAGEAGEAVDYIKKIVHHNRELNKDKLILELGDVLWYVEYLAATLDVDTNTIREANIAKLRLRYPDGYSHEAAKSRIAVKNAQNDF